MFLVSFIDIACFDLVPVDLIYPHIFDFQDSDAFNFEFETAGYESGYLPENMGTVFVFTHIFAFGLLLTFIFYFFRNKGRRGAKIYKKLSKRFLWNAIIIFLMEAFIEMGLCSFAVIKRFYWDPQGDFNNNMNMIYGIFYATIVIVYPFLILYIYCSNKPKLDKKQYRNYVAGPLESMRKLHKNRNIFYVTFYLARRVIFLIVVVIFEENMELAIWGLFISTELSAIFLINEKPFEDPFRNKMEIFNEIILLLLITTTLCFTGVMETEITVDVAWFMIGLLGIYMVIHVSSLLSDTVRKVFKYIWKMLNKCPCGKILRDRIKRRLELLKRKKEKPRPPIRRPLPVVYEESESSHMPTPNSSMNISEYEHIINEYSHRRREDDGEGASAATTSQFQSTARGPRDANMITNLLVVQRNHEIPDPLDQEMDFWMSEIEEMERVNREKRGLPPNPLL